MRILFAFVLLASALCLPLHASLTTYPDPPDAVTSPVFSLKVNGMPVKVSNRIKTRHQDGSWSHESKKPPIYIFND